jgi:hypothetical protein
MIASKTSRLANPVTQVQEVKHGRWMLVTDNSMFPRLDENAAARC